MKKLLFTLALIAGTFASQAQYSADNSSIEFTIFTSGSTTYGVAVGDNIVDRCVEVKAASGNDSSIDAISAELVYTVDSNGQRYRGTQSLGSPNPNYVNAFNSGTFYRLYTRTGTTFGNARNLTDSN